MSLFRNTLAVLGSVLPVALATIQPQSAATTTIVAGSIANSVTLQQRAPSIKSTFPAASCGSPCIISFNSIATTLTLTAPPVTVSVADSKNSITVSFSPTTTVVTFHPTPSTIANENPKATPTITIQPASIGKYSLRGSANYNTEQGQSQVVVQDDVEYYGQPAVEEDQGCPYPEAKVGPRPPDGEFDFLNCPHDHISDYLIAIEDARMIANYAYQSQIGEGFASYDEYFAPGHGEDLQKLSYVLSVTTDIRSDVRPHVRFVCLDQQTNDQFDGKYQRKCVERRTETEWCSVDIQTVPDADYDSHFILAAHTILHELSHVFAVTEPIGLTPLGFNLQNPEIYHPSECKALRHNDPEAATDNAQSHALSMAGE
ncbi:hypothetical protein GP486_000931 [Trichoglossum hirsutum]|uniref:Deuterolysin n=1 Tax=Trichoglossum hirsutum TaxID=265104 RepID=A0A9P8LGW5_9PEZI|nr:hypothetical protein GP486_000931 [Trichoglossum hirsutum]